MTHKSITYSTILLTALSTSAMQRSLKDRILDDQEPRFTTSPQNHHKGLLNTSLVKSESVHDSEKSFDMSSISKMPLKERLIQHQLQISNIFEVQEQRIEELEAEVATLRQTIQDKDAQLLEKDERIRVLTGNLETLRAENQSLSTQLSQKTISLQEALLREQEITQRMDQQKAQIEVIRQAVGVLKDL